MLINVLVCGSNSFNSCSTATLMLRLVRTQNCGESFTGLHDFSERRSQPSLCLMGPCVPQQNVEKTLLRNRTGLPVGCRS